MIEIIKKEVKISLFANDMNLFMGLRKLYQKTLSYKYREKWQFTKLTAKLRSLPVYQKQTLRGKNTQGANHRHNSLNYTLE